MMEDKMAAYEGVLLYDSIICRLCGTENAEGIYLYDNESEFDFKSFINRYLPLKIEDDGKLPRTICPGCNIQLETTIQFFDLLVEGQKKIRELYKLEVTTRKRLEKEKQALVETLEGNAKFSLVTDDREESLREDDIFIKILPDANFFGSEHEMTLKIEGLEKPRRKRGRPKKIRSEAEQSEPEPQPEPSSVPDLQKDQIEEEEFDENGRKRRRRKVPQRFMEAVQGKELDKILREEGAIDGNESDDMVADEGPFPGTVENKSELQVDGMEGMAGEVIGHLETPDGSIAEKIIAPIIGRGQHKRVKVTRFICDFCGQSFKDRTRWLRHRMLHKGMKFQCMQDLCLKRFSSRNKLKLHQKTTGHEGEDIVESDIDVYKSKKLIKPKLSCSHCNRSFASISVLSKHMTSEHPGEMIELKIEDNEKVNDSQTDDGSFTESYKVLYNVLTDKDSGEELKRNNEDDKNKKLKKEKSYACDECDRTFNHPSSLMYHKESVHNDGRRFVCSKCGKSFTHKQLLQRHQMVHSDTRPFPCPDCGLRFKTKSNLFNHRVVHTGEKKFSCQLCGQQFAHKTSLTLHLRWHKGHRPFQCPVCQKCFTQNGNLREHMRIHSGTKPYGCEYCGKHFTTSSQHKLHVKRHTGDRPWKCSHCEKTFLHKDTWRTHERRHTGEKPFQCSFCLRGFAEHWSLKKHVRVHTGEKPYKCPICEKEFADCSNLTKHRKHHAGVPVWSIIKSHLIDGMSQPGQQEDVQQIIYVTYQDNEDPSEGKTLHLVDNIQDVTNEEIRFDSEKEMMTMAGISDANGATDASEAEDYKLDGMDTTLQSHVGVTDEEGNPVQLTISDGRSIEIVSMDMESHVVQVRMNDGPGIFVQLPKNEEISEADLVDRIQQAVLVESKPKFHKSILLPRVHREPGNNDTAVPVDAEALTEDMLSTSQIISEEERLERLERLKAEGDKPLTEYEIESYKKIHEQIDEFLATQQCLTTESLFSKKNKQKT